MLDDLVCCSLSCAQWLENCEMFLHLNIDNKRKHITGRNKALVDLLAHLPLLPVFQSPDAHLSSLPNPMTSSFFFFLHFISPPVSSFSFSVTFFPFSHFSCLLLPCSVVSCFPHLSPSRGLIIGLMSHPI